jgi:hypothetical protein
VHDDDHATVREHVLDRPRDLRRIHREAGERRERGPRLAVVFA